MSDAQLLRLCRIHKVTPPPTTLAMLKAKARRRGIDIHIVIREEIIELLRAKMKRTV
jgi:hypothetical protein